MRGLQKHICIVITILIILLIAPSSFSQKNNYNFSSLDVSEGLTQRDVRALAQDEFGYLWIGTWNGINRYNGLEIENVSLPNPDSVKFGVQIDDLLYDGESRLWLASESGIFYYDIYLDKFIDIGFHIKTLCIAKDLYGNIWAGTYGNGVWVYKPEKDSIIQAFSSHNEDNWNYVYSIEQVSENNLFFGTPNGIISYNTDTKTTDTLINDLLDLHRVEIWDFYKENDSIIWMASWDKGLYKCNLKNGFSKNYRHREGQQSDISNNRVFSILKDNYGTLWIGTGNGLNIYIPEQDKFKTYYFDRENSNSIGSNNINTIFKSHDDVIWFGTKDAGLSYCGIINTSFNKIDKLSYLNKDLNVENVTSINSYNEGDILAIGSWEEGLFLFDNINGLKFRDNTLTDKIIVTLQNHNQNSLFAGTDGSGMYNVFIENNNIKTVKSKFILKNCPFASEYIYNISFNEQGSWIASWADGLYFSQNDTIYKIDINEETPSLVSLFIDSKNNLWVGTKRSGLFMANLDKFNPNKKLFFKHFSSEDNSELSNNEINCIAETKNGDIWIGTGYGLNKFDEKSDKFTCFYQKDGLANHLIFGIVEDMQMRLWISTGNGLNLYNPKTNEFIVFDKYNGLPFSEFNPRAFHYTRNNKVFFGGMEGLLWFCPDSVKINKKAAIPLITKVFVSGNEIKTGDRFQGEVLLKTNINKQKRIELPYKFNSLSLELGATHYVAPVMNKYKYKLEKKGDEPVSWNLVGEDRRFIIFSNLSPGDYTFYFTASNCDNQWNSEIKELQISILVPFYIKPWFLILSGLVFFTILYMVYYFRIRSIKRKNQKLESIVKERTEEIFAQKEEITIQMENLSVVNNELKDRQLEIELQADELTKLNTTKDKIFSVIGHDLKNPFHSITNLAAFLIQNNNTRKQDLLEYLNGIKETSENASDILENLLNWARTQSGIIKKKKEDILIEPIVKQNIGLIKLQAERKEIKIRTYIEEGCSVFADQNMIRVIIRNLLSNAVKFTNNGGEIAINALKKDDGVEIRVTDSGVGMTKEESIKLFDTSVFYSGFGTAGEKGTGIGSLLVKEFVDANEGTITVKSEKGKGTSIIILLPSGNTPAEKPKTIKNDKNAAPKIIPKELNQRISILIAEDNQPTRKMIAEYFSARYEVIEAENGSDALELAIENIPDLIISDVVMPKMDGIQFVSKTKTNINTCHIPIILLTAEVGEESQLEGLNQGADDYITKPFNIRLLDAKVSSMIKNREKLQEIFSKKLMLEPINQQVDSYDEKFIQEAIRMVQENIKSEDFNVEELAGKLSMSRVQLHRKFTALLNQKPHEFITDIRLKRAAQLLRDNQMRVSDVAFNTGYKDDSHFRKSFKKKFGVSPSEYKENK